jgi:LmbE family N-acetylglucosaminyl deacetylase
MDAVALRNSAQFGMHALRNFGSPPVVSPPLPPPAIEGDGTPEAIWQAWSLFRQVPEVSSDDLCPASARLVVLAPHPDDEILACGGLLAQHVESGGEALVLAATHGEASHCGIDAFKRIDVAALGRLRCSESAEGLRRLLHRVCPAWRLGLPDGRLKSNRHALLAALLGHVRPGDVVTTTWRSDAHPDHDACGDAARDACALLGCKLLEAPVWMWHWSSPGDKRVPWHRLVKLALPPDLVLRKQYALYAHASQLSPRGPQTGPVLGAQILQRLVRPHEYFFSP